MPDLSRLVLGICLLLLAACGKNGDEVSRGTFDPPLHPGETPELRESINEAAAYFDIPPELLHRVIQRESDYNASARNGPYYGLMQILPATAGTMGFSGSPSDLLDAETNLLYAGAYLRGAYIVANGNIDRAIQWYANGYYYEARNRCLLIETGLNDNEVKRGCT